MTMKTLERTGSHIYMSPEEIERRSGVLAAEHETYLQKYGVALPTR